MEIGVVTVPYCYPQEIEQLRLLHSSGIDHFHLRKEGDAIMDAVANLPLELHQVTTVHISQHYIEWFISNIEQYNFCSIHHSGWAFQSSAQDSVQNIAQVTDQSGDQVTVPYVRGIINSYPIHSLEELSQLSLGLENRGVNMPISLVISPIFDSLSKSNYPSRWSLEELTDSIEDIRSNLVLKLGVEVTIVALGGVTVDRFKSLEEAHFYRALMLGAIWGNAPEKQSKREFSKQIERVCQTDREH